MLLIFNFDFELAQCVMFKGHVTLSTIRQSLACELLWTVLVSADLKLRGVAVADANLLTTTPLATPQLLRNRQESQLAVARNSFHDKRRRSFASSHSK